jgi:hypothetical protein
MSDISFKNSTKNLDRCRIHTYLIKSRENKQSLRVQTSIYMHTCQLRQWLSSKIQFVDLEVDPIATWSGS